jgi:hypothetical protein
MRVVIRRAGESVVIELPTGEQIEVAVDRLAAATKKSGDQTAGEISPQMDNRLKYSRQVTDGR